MNEKPWITRGILTSIKTKNRLFKKYYKSNSFDLQKKQQYKKYLNKLTHIKNIAKRSYYKNLIKKNKRNPSQTWSIIKCIIDFKNSTNKAKLPSTIMIKQIQKNFLILHVSILRTLELICPKNYLSPTRPPSKFIVSHA